MLRSGATKMGVTFVTSGRTASLEKNSDDSWHYRPEYDDTAAIDARLLIDPGSAS